MSEESKEITLKKGNLYISVTVVLSMMAGMFWGGFIMGKFNERLNRIEYQIIEQSKDIKQLINDCK